MSLLAYKDVDFENKVQIGSCLNGNIHCCIDLEKIKQDCVRLQIYWDYNIARAREGLSPITEEEMKTSIFNCFNQPGYAVPFTWHAGIFVFLYRKEDDIYIASLPILETETKVEEKEIPISKPWWKFWF